MHPSRSHTVILVLLILFAGCNGLGTDRDTATVTPAPVPTVTEVAPKEGSLYLENQRAEAYRVKLLLYPERIANITVAYENGTEQSLLVHYTPTPRVQIGESKIPLGPIEFFPGDVSEIEPDGDPMWEEEVELPVRSARSVDIPEEETEFVIFAKVFSTNRGEMQGLYVWVCDSPSKQPELELRRPDSMSRGGC